MHTDTTPPDAGKKAIRSKRDAQQMARHLASSLIGMYAGAWDEFAEFKFLTPEEQEQVNEAMRDVESLLDRVRPSDRLDAYIEDARDRWVAGAQSGQREAADA